MHVQRQLGLGSFAVGLLSLVCAACGDVQTEPKTSAPDQRTDVRRHAELRPAEGGRAHEDEQQTVALPLQAADVARSQENPTLLLHGARVTAGEPFLASCLPPSGSVGRSQNYAVEWQAEALVLRDGPERARLTAAPKGPALPRNPALQQTAGGLVLEQAGIYAVRCTIRDGQNVARTSAAGELKVESDRAVGWELRLHRQGNCFNENTRLPYSYRAWDRFGNTVFPIQIEFTTEPETTMSRDASNGLIFHESGEFALTSRGVGPKGEQLPPQHAFVPIDSTPPTIVLDDPARAEMVFDNDFNRVLRGRVVDRRNRIVAFSVERHAETLAPDPNYEGPGNGYTFAVPFTARWGLNVVHAKATDACGNSALLVHSFYQSGDYAPPLWRQDEASGQQFVGDLLPQAAQATLAQELWDQGDTSSEQDLRHLVEVSLANGGLNERLPTHLAHSDALGMDVYRDGPLTLSSPSVEALQIVPDGFFVRLVLSDIRQPIITQNFRLWPSLSLRAMVSAEQVTIDALAKVTMGDGGPEVTICPSCVQAKFSHGGPRVTIRRHEPQTPAMQRFAAPILDFVLSFSRRFLTDALNSRIQRDMVRELTRVLSGLKLQHALKAPPPLQANISVQSGLDNIALTGSGPAARSALSLSSRVEVLVPPPSAPHQMPMPPPGVTVGPIRGWSQGVESGPLASEAKGHLAAPTLDDGSADTFAISVSDNLLNQMFWSIWAQGTLHSQDVKQATEQTSGFAGNAEDPRNLLDEARLRVHFLAPPVVMPSRYADEIRIGVGDIYAEVDVDTASVLGFDPSPEAERLKATCYFSLSLRAKLAVDNDNRSLRIASLRASHAEVQVLQISSPSMFMAVTHWLQKMIGLSMPAHLARFVVGVPLPNLQIGRLPGMPPQALWALDDVSLSRAPGAQETILRGRFGALPVDATLAETPASDEAP